MLENIGNAFSITFHEGLDMQNVLCDEHGLDRVEEAFHVKLIHGNDYQTEKTAPAVFL